MQTYQQCREHPHSHGCNTIQIQVCALIHQSQISFINLLDTHFLPHTSMVLYTYWDTSKYKLSFMYKHSHIHTGSAHSVIHTHGYRCSKCAYRNISTHTLRWTGNITYTSAHVIMTALDRTLYGTEDSCARHCPEHIANTNSSDPHPLK